jgi:hypothetical protein
LSLIVLPSASDTTGCLGRGDTKATQLSVVKIWRSAQCTTTKAASPKHPTPTSTPTAAARMRFVQTLGVSSFFFSLRAAESGIIYSSLQVEAVELLNSVLLSLTSSIACNAIYDDDIQNDYHD